MDIKPGYKHSDVGLIPEDWNVKPLHAVAERIMVGIASAATHAYRDRGIIMFRNQNIKPNHLDDSDILFLAEQYEIAFKNKRLKAGDLLTARTGYPGTTSVVPAHYEGAQTFTTLITRPRQQVINSDFLCRFINSEAGQNYVGQNQAGGGQKNVNAGSLMYLPVPIPPTKLEQESIAAVLGDADALTGSLERLIAKTRQIKQGVIQDLLTSKRRLPGFTRKWKTRRLGDIAETDPETLSSDTRPDYSFNYITLEDVDEGRLLSYSELSFQTAPSRARRKVRYQDVLISTVRPNLKSHLLFRAQRGEWVCSTGFCVVRCREQVSDPAFVYFQLFGDCVARQIESLLTGSNYPSINGCDVRSLEIPIPDYAEQVAISDVLCDMDAEIAALEAKLAKARQIKQGMMQELLTGRIRLVCKSEKATIA